MKCVFDSDSSDTPILPQKRTRRSRANPINLESEEDVPTITRSRRGEIATHEDVVVIHPDTPALPPPTSVTQSAAHESPVNLTDTHDEMMITPTNAKIKKPSSDVWTYIKRKVATVEGIEMIKFNCDLCEYSWQYSSANGTTKFNVPPVRHLCFDVIVLILIDSWKRVCII
eukprot:TRINITY_DN270_c0_g1_i7.p1 TRINITY_DN270_c0_g1~~TRINITY_DN270_c0_g1_i7.p1  ORF type:complete len:171 (+),score=50.86 TRINITY_DN270_c0_g1_i7:694-1206(+)